MDITEAHEFIKNGQCEQLKQWLIKDNKQAVSNLDANGDTLRPVYHFTNAVPKESQELAKNGVLQSMQHSHKQDLGELSASVQQGQRQGQDKGQGRG